MVGVISLGQMYMLSYGEDSFFPCPHLDAVPLDEEPVSINIGPSIYESMNALLYVSMFLPVSIAEKLLDQPSWLLINFGRNVLYPAARISSIPTTTVMHM